MCFYFQQSKDATEFQHRFKAKFENAFSYKPSQYNGFTYPQTPVITNLEPTKIQLFHWGLIPHWAKDNSFRKHTLNAKSETLAERPSFRYSINKRCLILADAFYEWQWLDEKGKKKQKYKLSFTNSELFALAGIWSEWTDKSTGEIINSYSILTTSANKLMSEIHNSKKRMPIILSEANEQQWLQGGELKMKNDELLAEAVG